MIRKTENGYAPSAVMNTAAIFLSKTCPTVGLVPFAGNRNLSSEKNDPVLTFLISSFLGYDENLYATI